MRLDIHRFRDDKLDITDLEITKLGVFTVQRWRTGRNSKQKGRLGYLSVQRW